MITRSSFINHPGSSQNPRTPTMLRRACAGVVADAAEAAVPVVDADADVDDCVRVPRRVVICFQVAQHRSCRRRPTNIYIYIHTCVYRYVHLLVAIHHHSSSSMIHHDSSHASAFILHHHSPVIQSPHAHTLALPPKKSL